MDIVHPDLVAGCRVTLRDERDNPIGSASVRAATLTTLTLRIADSEVELSAAAILRYSRRDGIAIAPGSLGPAILAKLAAS